MVKCPICETVVTDIRICKNCGRSFCPADSGEKCALCDGELITANIEEGNWEGSSVSWVNAGGTRIGLVGQEHIPPQAGRIIQNRMVRRSTFDVLVFPNKSASNMVYALTQKRWGATPPHQLEDFEGSRYSWIVNERTKQGALLLNLPALRESVEFILDYFDTLLATATSRSAAFEKGVHKTLFELLALYNEKIGFTFVTYDERTQDWGYAMSIGVYGAYTEYVAYRATIAKSNLNLAADFLERKIEMYYRGIDWTKLHDFGSVVSILGSFSNMLVSASAAVGYPIVQKSASQRVLGFLKEASERLKDRKDLLGALENLVTHIPASQEYDSLDGYLSSIRQAFLTSVGKLEPHYVRLNELTAIIEATKLYTQQVELGNRDFRFRFGNVEEFLAVLRGVYSNKENFAEARLISAQAALSILTSSMVFGGDQNAYFEAKSLAGLYAQIVEEGLSMVKSRSPIDWISHSDPALTFGQLSAYARHFENENVSRLLFQRALKLATDHNLQSLQKLLFWQEFLVTYDYMFLRRVASLSEGEKNSAKHAPTEKMVTSLAKALIDQDTNTEDLRNAEACALEMAESPGEWTPMSLIGASASRIYLHICAMLSHLFEYEHTGNNDDLRQARVESEAALMEMSEGDPLTSIVSRTKIVYALLNDDKSSLAPELEKLRRLCRPKSDGARYASSIRDWIGVANQRRRLKLTHLLNAQFDDDDIWSRISFSFVRSKVLQDIKDAEFIDVDAVFLVEGVTDERVLSWFSKHLKLAHRILFIPTEGWTSSPSYAVAKTALKLRKPVTVLFDGDTSQEKKRAVKLKVVARLRSRKVRIVTLQQSSIESYLLNPRAIKSAFNGALMSEAEIADFLKERNNKRNKKDVIDELSRKVGLAKYNPSVASEIAKNIRTDEIDGEIVRILNDV
jgi:hypothetical protein